MRLTSVALAGLVAVAGCREARRVELGMTPDEVQAVLGPPEGRLALEGKDLRPVTEAEAAALPPGRRVAFVYDGGRVQVWFDGGGVTAMTEGGVAVPLAAKPSPSP